MRACSVESSEDDMDEVAAAPRTEVVPLESSEDDMDEAPAAGPSGSAAGPPSPPPPVWLDGVVSHLYTIFGDRYELEEMKRAAGATGGDVDQAVEQLLLWAD